MAKQPAECLTLDSFIESGSQIEEKYSLFNLYTKSDVDGLIRPIYNILQDYKKEIIDYTVDVKLSDEQIDRYMYNPKRLAYEYYKRTDLYFLILFINNMSNVKEFTLESGRLKMLKYTDLIRILSDIIASEGKLINSYNNTYA